MFSIRRIFVAVSAATALLLTGCAQTPKQADAHDHGRANERVEGAMVAGGPRYAVDALWPKPLPNNWILGQVAGIATAKDDTIWMIHRRCC